MRHGEVKGRNDAGGGTVAVGAFVEILQEHLGRNDVGRLERAGLGCDRLRRDGLLRGLAGGIHFDIRGDLWHGHRNGNGSRASECGEEIVGIRDLGRSGDDWWRSVGVDGDRRGLDVGRRPEAQGGRTDGGQVARPCPGERRDGYAEDAQELHMASA